MMITPSAFLRGREEIFERHQPERASDQVGCSTAQTREVCKNLRLAKENFGHLSDFGNFPCNATSY